MRNLALAVTLFIFALDVHAQAKGPYAPRDDSTERRESSDQIDEGKIQPEEDSWRAPPRAKDGLGDYRSAGGIVRGMDVAGSSRVRERRNTSEQGTSAPARRPGFHAVPLGGGMAIVVPDGGSYSGRDSFEYDSRPPADPIDGR
jgi:hypothetical protein